jgi:transcriptional regulator with XRE-family HTH domain
MNTGVKPIDIAGMNRYVLCRIFGEIVKERRELLRKSQTELAREVGVFQSMISLIEGGRRFPSPNLLLALGMALRLSAGSLMDELEERVLEDK